MAAGSGGGGGIWPPIAPTTNFVSACSNGKWGTPPPPKEQTNKTKTHTHTHTHTHTKLSASSDGKWGPFFLLLASYDWNPKNITLPPSCPSTPPPPPPFEDPGASTKHFECRFNYLHSKFVSFWQLEKKSLMGFVYRVVWVLKALWIVFVWNHQYFDFFFVHKTNIFGMLPKIYHRVMYIAPSTWTCSCHELLNLNLPFKLILRRFEVVFRCLES